MSDCDDFGLNLIFAQEHADHGDDAHYALIVHNNCTGRSHNLDAAASHQVPDHSSQLNWGSIIPHNMY
ncbi:MAG: hypothetical protein IT427_08345 [Pirellulales bacterium]|nr:hypothetical protein [Pirellulales bacterium]